jgi:hypothetical protein
VREVPARGNLADGPRKVCEAVVELISSWIN